MSPDDALDRQVKTRKVHDLMGQLERACKDAGWQFQKLSTLSTAGGREVSAHIKVTAPY